MFNSLVHQLARPSCKLCSCLRSAPSLNINQIRTTYILKRRHEPPLAKKGSVPSLKTKHFVYDLVENTDLKKKKSIKCILLKKVPGIGDVGDIVFIKSILFRRHLFPAGEAVYCNDDHIMEFKHLLRSPELTANSPPTTTRFVQKMLKELSGFHPRICMNGDIPWTLDKSHVRIACRFWGVTVNEDSITLPEEPISKPQKFTFKVTVRNDRCVDINATVYEVFSNKQLNHPTEFPSIWGNEDIEQEKNVTLTDSENVALNESENVTSTESEIITSSESEDDSSSDSDTDKN